MNGRTNPTPQPTTTAPDPEAQLFARLVARVLSWPCKRCGETGVCKCYWPPAPTEPKPEAQR